VEAPPADTDALVRELRRVGRVRRGLPMCEAADTIERLTRENAALKTVMAAAAEEIHAHWQAHCDAEGYGPQNLMRRLEEGIPSEYGYTAGAFAELKRERDEAVARERGRWESALKQTWQMIDPLHPPGSPGSYARGEYHGIVAALNTLRENADRAIATTKATT
jgi:hypothetical protein